MLKTLDDQEFKGLLQKADFLTSDGIGLYIAYQILDFSVCHSQTCPKNPENTKTNFFHKILLFLLLPYFIFNILFRKKMLSKKYGERICGSDLTKNLLDFSEKNSVQIAILDLYNPTDEKKVASQKIFPSSLQKKFPNLRFDYFIYETEKKSEIIKKIANSEAKILFSTLGMKKQEASIVEVMKKAKNIKIGLGIGSSFDYFIGFQKRAPKIWRQTGFEWLYRLLTGPRKIHRLKRLWNAIIVFPMTVILKK